MHQPAELIDNLLTTSVAVLCPAKQRRLVRAISRTDQLLCVRKTSSGDVATLFFDWELRTTVVNLHNSANQAEATGNDLTSWLKALHEAEEIDLRLEEWEKCLPDRWLCRSATHSLLTMLQVNLDYYSDIQVGKVWNQYRCARILLHETIIEILECLLFISSNSRDNLVRKMKRSAQTITTLLSAICDSIPFHLRRVNSRGDSVSQTSQRVLGGEHLLWPLDVVYHSHWSNASQRSQARKALEEISNFLGLRQAAKSMQAKQQPAN